MAKRHKIPADRIVRIPAYLTPMQPIRGEFTRFTTQCPIDLWNLPTLLMVARHSYCAQSRHDAAAELARRGA